MNLMEQWVDDLRDNAESMFRTSWGPPAAFFEIPRKGESPLRVVYVTYACSGTDVHNLLDWMRNKVLVPLRREAGEGAYLYWRLPECIDLQRVEEKWQIRTRLAVLDKDVRPVAIAASAKAEGGKMKELKEPTMVQDHE